MVKEVVTEFKLVFDGVEFDDHAIDAIDLGKSLISLSNIVREANSTLNGSDSKIELEVKAQEKGSFETLLMLVQMGDGLNVAEILGLGAATSAVGGGLIGLVKSLAGRRVSEYDYDESTETLTTTDGKDFEVSKPVFRLLHNKEVRKEIANVLFVPVDKETTIRIKDESDHVLHEVTSETADYFKAPIIRGRTVTKTEDVEIKFTAVNFLGKTGWKFIPPDEKSEITVTITDDAFFDAVALDKVSFSNDAEFLVELEIKEIDNEDVVTKKYTIKKIHL